MIKHRNTPYIIDYQGAMMGPPLYDIASLLWDPYHNLNNDIRDDLLSYYQSEIEKNISKKSYAKISTESLAICRLQRHMQALGAYGFLSIIKGKRYFMKYINSGIDLLKDDIIIFKEDLPELYSLINKIHKLNL
jgi:aminoglycoside/choline kinase family phosphotransferase